MKLVVWTLEPFEPGLNLTLPLPSFVQVHLPAAAGTCKMRPLDQIPPFGTHSHAPLLPTAYGCFPLEQQS